MLLGASRRCSGYPHDGVERPTHEGYGPQRASVIRCTRFPKLPGRQATSGRAPLKICIASDSHDRADPLLAAAQAAARAGATALIHCGDVIGANTLRPLDALALTVHVVHGNNLGDALALARLAAASQGRLHYHGGEAELVLGGRRIYVTHFPHQARGMACTGDYDLVCCGHSHAAETTRQPDIRGERTWLVNPGTVAGIAGAPATWILGDLERMRFEIRTL